MATAALFIGWSRPAAGRENDAWKFLMGEATELIAGFQKRGFFERIDQIALTPHCGDLNGFILLHGERAKLDELRRTDEFERFSVQMMMRFEGYGVIPGLNGEGLAKAFARNKDLVG